MAKPTTLKPTGLQELSEYGKGTLVPFPDFAEGQPFVARLRRPSMLSLVKQGKIPNKLLSTANTLFANNSFDVGDDEAMKNLFEVIDVLAEACFLEPTYAELRSAGVELTDDQMMFLFNYTQQGVKALDSFRR
jgi:hypothetical protein